MIRSDKTVHLCETPPYFAKGNSLTNKALEEMVIIDVLLKLLIFHFCVTKRNAQKITLRMVRSVHHERHIKARGAWMGSN